MFRKLGLWTLLMFGGMTMCEAQTSVHEGFEGYAEGQLFGIGYNLTGYGDPDAYPTVRSSAYGISPSSGNRMLDVRSRATGGLHLLGRNTGDILPSPVAMVSIYFCVPSLDFSGQTLEVGLDDSIFRYVSLDLTSGKVKYEDHPEIEIGRLDLDVWHRFTARYDYKNETFDLAINGISFYHEYRGPFDTAPPNLFSFGTMLKQSPWPKYSLEEGAPGILFDDYRYVAVPDPATGVALLGAVGALAIRKNKA